METYLRRNQQVLLPGFYRVSAQVARLRQNLLQYIITFLTTEYVNIWGACGQV